MVASTKLPNTERTRHMLQLSFCLLATGATRGYIVVSASDGCAVYPLHHSASEAIFDVPPVPAIKSAPSGRRPRRGRTPLAPWPGAKVVASKWEQINAVGRHGALLCKEGELAFACAARTSTGAAVAATRAAARASKAKVKFGLLFVPVGRRWLPRRIQL